VIRILTNLSRTGFAMLLALSTATTDASADVVHDWNIQLLRVTSPVGPPQARLLAIMHVAMHDAINSITGEYETYGPRVNAPFGASPGAAAAVAAHQVLMTLVPSNMIPANPTYDEVLNTRPERIIEKAIKGMLPHNTLGRQMLSKLKVYAGPTHPHQAQAPVPFELKQVAQ